MLFQNPTQAKIPETNWKAAWSEICKLKPFWFFFWAGKKTRKRKVFFQAEKAQPAPNHRLFILFQLKISGGVFSPFFLSWDLEIESPPRN